MKVKTTLQRLLKKGRHLAFEVKSIADLNVVKGLIRILNLDRRHAVIRFDGEITAPAAQKAFFGFRFVKKFPETCLRISFDTEGPDRMHGQTRVILNYVPYKFFPFSRSSYSLKKRMAVRRAMKVQKKRKIICVSCTGRNEVLAVLKAARKAPLLEKPLIVFGLRKPDWKLTGMLTARGFKAVERHTIHQSLWKLSRAEAVVLNTAGEFFEFMRAADLAIIGHDRNIFEPAFLRVPILYFKMPLEMSREEESTAKLFGLFWRKNRLAKKILDQNEGAIPIRIEKFPRQIASVLNRPRPLIRGGQKAVRKFESKMIPPARRRVLKLFEEVLREI